MHLPQQLNEHAHPVLQTRRSWYKNFPELLACQCAVSWADYSHTWYRCVCTCSWVRSFTQLWIIHQDLFEGQELNYFDVSNYRKVKKYLWFPRKWNHNSISYWILRFHRVRQNQHILVKWNGSPVASYVEKSWIHDGICRIGQQSGNRRNPVAVKDRSICLC